MTATVHTLPSAGGTPPHNLDAETSVLGAILLRADAIPELADMLRAEDFYRGAHRTVYETITGMAANGLPVDSVSLTEELDRRGRLSDVGGPVAISDLIAKVPTAANAAHYARIVAGHARRRRLQAAAGELHAAASTVQDLDAAVHVGVEQILAATRRMGAGGIVTAASLVDHVRERRDRGEQPRGLTCGWPSVDKLYRPLPDQMTVLTGVPSHGKSTWLDAYLARMASRHGWRTLFFSPERRPGDHAARLVALGIGKPLRVLGDDELDAGLGWVDEHFRWIDDTAQATVASLAAAARHVAATGLNCLVVDPWNWVETNKPDGVTTAEHIGRSLAELMRLAHTAALHVCVVAHPTKMRRQESGRLKGAYLVPRPYDISESANWFNRPDWCLTVWRDHLQPPFGQPGYQPDRDPHVVDVHVQKARHDDCGQVGIASLRFRPHVRTYHELADDPL